MIFRPLIVAAVAHCRASACRAVCAGPPRAASPNDLRLSYAPVVQRVAPAVVNVYAAKVVHNRNPLFEDPIFRRFFGVPGDRAAAATGAALARLRRASSIRPA